ncbi:methyltransferase-like protein 25B [Phaenicophaeus curvirostris]|uniref:methyltransferase-like protein 25B n=1 Tax=Phaenicophaeus curvirostris TaxID=33595 RepID=UPI0037F0FBF9
MVRGAQRVPAGEDVAAALSPARRRVADIVRLLALYRPLLDAYVIDFFAEGLWGRVPPLWQPPLAAATPPQLAGLLGGSGGPGGGPGGPWPLSLLAFAAAARALALPRCPPGPPLPLPPLLRRHLKPKKQHEVQRLAKLLWLLAEATGCHRVVDVGAGQGHLSRFLALGLGLAVTALEGDARLAGRGAQMDRRLQRELSKGGGKGRRKGERGPGCLPPRPGSRRCPPRAPRHLAGRLDPWSPGSPFLLPPHPPIPAAAAPNPFWGPGGARGGRRVLVAALHACGDLSPALLRHFARSPALAAVASVPCCHMKLSTSPQPAGRPLGYPLSAWVATLPGHELSYRAREAACHALEEYRERLGEESDRLRVHCYRAALETLIRAAKPGMKHPGVQTVKKSHALTFAQYARLGLPRVGLDPDAVPLESEEVKAMLEQQHKVVAFFTLTQLLAPLVETLILLDRLLFLREQGFHCALIPLFDPRFSPRNLALVAARTPLGPVLSGLKDQDPVGAKPPGDGQDPPP